MKANAVAAVLAAAMTMVAPAAGHSQQAAAVARVRWHIPATATLKEPIVATVEIENLSDDTINIDLGIDEKTMFSLHEIMPDGSSHTASPLLPSNGLIFLRPSKTIQPRSTGTSDLLLDPWLKFDQIGSYQIGIRFLGRAYYGVGMGVRPLTERVEPPREVAVDASQGIQRIQVLPRDESVLRQRCEDWMRSANTTPNPSERSRKLAALLEMVDPVAVPYLQDAIERFQVDGAFGTLVRIGTPEAKSAVEQMAKSKDRLLAQKAKSVLPQFGK